MNIPFLGSGGGDSSSSSSSDDADDGGSSFSDLFGGRSRGGGSTGTRGGSDDDSGSSSSSSSSRRSSRSSSSRSSGRSSSSSRSSSRSRGRSSSSSSSSSDNSSSSSSSSSSDDDGGGFLSGVRKRVDRARDTVEETVDDAVDTAKDTADDVVDRFKEHAPREAERRQRDRQNRFTGRIDDAVEDVGDTVDRARDTVEDTAEDVSRTVDRTVDDAVDTARNTADDARDTARNVGRNVDRTVDRAQDTAKDTARDVGQELNDVVRDVTEPEPQTGAGRSSGPSNAYMGIAAGLDTQEGAERTQEAIRESATEPASEARENMQQGVDDFTQRAHENVTPHALMTADEAGLEARAARERTFAERAGQGWDDLTDGELPSKAEAGAMWFQGVEYAEQGITDVGHAIQEGSPTQGQGPEVLGDPIGSWPGMAAGMLVGGVGGAVGAVGQYPVTAAADLTGDATYKGETPTEAAGGFGDVAGRTAQRQVEYAMEHPGPTALTLAIPMAETGAAFTRGYRSGGRGGQTVPWEAITDQHGAKGEVSRFETRPTEPTSKAVNELTRRAGDQPEAIKQASGMDEILYHTTGDKLGEPIVHATGSTGLRDFVSGGYEGPRSVKVGEGASELPGLWTAPDANPVGLRGTNFGGRSGTSFVDYIRPSKPDLRTTTDRVAAFEGDRIAGMPESAKGAGYEVRGPGGEILEAGLGRGQAKARASKIEGASVGPDTSTSGYRFLTEGAEPGTAYARPRGSRTPEQEAIFPPESQFAEASGATPVNVRVGGREINIPFTERSITFGGEELPMDFFRRVEAAPDEAGATTAKSGASTGSGSGTVGAGEISRTYTSMSELGQPSGISVGNYGVAMWGAGDIPDMTGDGPTATESPSTSPTEPTPMISETAYPSGPIDETGMTSEPGSATDPTSSPTETTEPTSPTEPTPMLSETAYPSGPIDETGMTSEPTSTTSTTSTTEPTSSPTETTEPTPTYTTTTTTSTTEPTSPPSDPTSPPSKPPSDPSRPSRGPPRYSPPADPMYRMTPFTPDESGPYRPGRRGSDRDKDNDEYPPGWVDPFDVAFVNPIASGMEVLFGNMGAFGNRMDVMPEEVSSSEPMAGSAPPFYGERSWAPFDPDVPAEEPIELPGQPVFDEFGRGFHY